MLIITNIYNFCYSIIFYDYILILHPYIILLILYIGLIIYQQNNRIKDEVYSSLINKPGLVTW